LVSFLLKAEPHRTYRCPNCAAELTRSGWVWVSIVIVALVVAGLLGWLSSQGRATLIGIGIVVVVLGTLLVKVVNYNLIRWQEKGGS
jgi:predicted lysophospholipase L1 biosynthesis ABC-type transport system permease subunit